MVSRIPPLKERIIKSSQTSSTQAIRAAGSSSYGRANKKNWTEDRMKAALKAISLKGISVRQAADEYDIPMSTLHDRVSGKALPFTSCGAHRYLSDNEECELESFLISCAKIGYGKTRSEVIALVQRFLKSRDVERVVSNGWWEGFCRRHPNITLRTPASLSKARALATTHEVINQYFDILEDVLTTHNLFDKPYQIFNLDETGMPLDPKPLKVVASRGEKDPSSVRGGRKNQITAVGCVSAGGSVLPPMIIWNGKSLCPNQASGEIPGTLHGFSPKGWMDQELFNLWFVKHFLKYAPQARPLLLLLDGHSSHFCPETIRLAAKEKVIIFTFPPNTTHLTQPLDKGIFGPLKLNWRKACQQFCNNNPHMAISKYSFCSIFSDAWMQSMTVRNIRNSFSKTGVYPFDRDAIELPIEASLTPDECGIYTFYSPAISRKKSCHNASLSPATPQVFSPALSVPVVNDSPTQSVVQPWPTLSPVQSSSPSPVPSPEPSLVTFPVTSPVPSPAPSPALSLDENIVFTKEEVLKFQRRFENGYDIKTDHRYNSWLKTKQASNTTCSKDDIHQPSYKSSFSHFLKLPSPPKQSIGEQLHSDRVITSFESRKRLEDKEEKKKEKIRQKEIRKKAAELKHQQKAEAKSTAGRGRGMMMIISF